MADEINDWPEEGELLVCSVKSVKENGAYLTLDSYPGKDGFGLSLETHSWGERG